MHWSVHCSAFSIYRVGHHFKNSKKDKPRGDRPPIKLKIPKENIKIEPDPKREKESLTNTI